MTAAFGGSVAGMSSGKFLGLAALSVVVLLGVVWYQHRQVRTMARTIETLQASRNEKDDDAQKARPFSRSEEKVPLPEPAARAGQETPAPATGSYEVLKELEDDSATDPRSYAEKLQRLLADNPTPEAAAVASRFIFNKATDRQGLPDDELQAIYASQTDPDLKRVIAQVMSQRDDDSLLKDQIDKAQVTLKSANPRDRLDALGQIGKLHSVLAVDAIAPLLQDSDSTVRLAALFALRDSGNQLQVSLVEPMTRDPDPSVSTLAANVVDALKNLSPRARTGFSRADIEAELPPIANP
jgi:HEAT repeat protein